MTRRWKWLALSALAVLALGVGSAGLYHLSEMARVRRALVQHEEASNVTHAELLMEFPRAIRESSGVAASVLNPGLFWTHNDSGHGPILYAVRPSDSLLAEVRLDGAPSRDWEDIATGPCLREARRTCLYVGDIGDNRARRRSLTLLLAEEPRLSGSGALPEEIEWTAIPLAYHGGPRNAEALAVSQSGDLLVVSRSGIVFRASRQDLEAGLDGSLVVLYADGALALAPSPPAYDKGVVTAAATVGADLVVRTYEGIHFYHRTGNRWEEARQPCWAGHLGPLGEGLDVAPPDLLYLTREQWFGFGRPAALHRVTCPP